ncbi:membrane-associated phospholipid phosphatase [Kitasatospora gansuensis]|uniref:Membrane-associated phospholipid phosphatase n=1 Tax=Kitasatospora gansuensis TaxID=258050 RepID=A0A7W7WKC6_9ACTN|nr:hypothetical protein [Kitasatospora gansuensis]MBB4950251.1 membrane-associated phospholipid phosphatase [Kitasatospora gansuensis]
MSTFTAPETPVYRAATPRERAAKAITDVLAPANLVIGLLLLVGWQGSHSWRGLGWGLLAALFCGVIPLGIILLGVKRGALTDKHIRVRRQRMIPMGASLVSVVAGVTALYLMGAPAEVSALAVAMLVGLATSLLVTVWWQISIHNSVAGGAALILLLVFGPLLALAAAAVAAIGWSRLVLKAHTLPQVLAGTALGSVAALTFALLR